MRDEILTSLLRLFRGSDTPWVTDDELQMILRKNGKPPSREVLYSSVEELRNQGFVEVQSIGSGSLKRGFIVRLSVQGRNLYVHGRPSLVQ